MRKYIYALTLLFLLCFPFTIVEGKPKEKTTTTTTTMTTTTALVGKKVNIYVFYGIDSNPSSSLHDYLSTLKSDPELSRMFEVVDYEITQNKEYEELFEKVLTYFDYDAKGVPFYVVGDTYFSGYTKKKDEEIVATIKEKYSNLETPDVVGDIAKGAIDFDKLNHEEKKQNQITGYIILGITAFAIGGIVFGRKRTE